MSGTREENVFMARISEQAERYEDMVEYMRRVAKMPDELNLDERNLLSVAYKNAVGSRRSAWRAVHGSEQREGAMGGPEVAQMIADYRVKVESELNSKCFDIIDILNSDLIPKSSTNEAVVFYRKMKGDYHRYVAEFASGDLHANHAREAEAAYREATAAATELPAANPIRLGLALNYSVFFNEVLGDAAQACLLAKTAFDDAVGVMDSLDDESARDSAQIMQLLRDNLTLWSANQAGAGGGYDGTACEDL